MAEIKNIFHKGIMNKDLDERLVPNGQFRDAMNIQVSTSESSEIGTVQNILGNVRAEDIISNYNSSYGVDLMCVGAIADEKNDVLYWFVSSNTIDAILEYRDDGTVTPILVDRNKNVLEFNSTNIITGINVIDNLLFWTDDWNEPKKINIDTLKLNNHTDLLTHSDMFVKDVSVGEITVDHITVIRKRPQRAPVVLFDNEPFEPIAELLELNFYGAIVDTVVEFDDGPWRYSQLTLTNSASDVVFPYSVGEEFVLSLDSEPGSLPYNYQIKVIVDGIASTVTNNATSGLGLWINTTFPSGVAWTSSVWNLKIVEIDRIYENENLIFNATQIPETDPIFERELIRFATRWKYVDGEYSAYSPFTVPIFLAGQFYFHPTDDPFNQGMESRATSLTIKDFIREDIPNDVVQVDILFKKEKSTTIYSIDSVKIDDTHPTPNLWNGYDNNKDGTYISSLNSVNDFSFTFSLDLNERGKSGVYKVTTENIYAALPDNQMLRPWDNVPRKALSQEVTANRIIYGNYLQNYNLRTIYNEIVTPWITLDSEHRDYLRVGGGSSPSLPVTFTNNQAKKSIKSLRTYYLGIVYGDKYGRETPVLTSKDASHHIPFDWDNTVGFDGAADDSTRLTAKLTGDQPFWAHYFKYFIKQTTGEYYNLTLDRVYKAAGDENLWVSFPSSDRNKIEVGDYFSIKKQVDIEEIIPVENKIKIIDIKNEAPESIKYDYVSLGSGGGSQANLDNLFIDPSAQPAQDVKRLLVDKSTWVDDENGLALEDLHHSDRLAVQFTVIESGNTIHSEKYFVTGFSVEDNGGDEQYNLLLRKTIEEADSWVESSIGVLNYAKGLTITIYKLEEKNPVEFEGRFFVKIISNPVTQTYLVPSTTDIYAFQVLGVLKMFNLYDNVGDFGSNTLGIFNTINTWSGNNTGAPYGLSGWGAEPGELEWAANAAFDTGINNTGGWFLDNTAFVAAQQLNTTNARRSGKMWKGNLYDGATSQGTVSSSVGQDQYINGLEGLISPTLSGPASGVSTPPNVTQAPYNHNTSGSNAFGGARRWSSEVIDLRHDWDYGVTSAGNTQAGGYQYMPIPTPAPWDDTYDCVVDGGHWIHLSFLAPGVDLHGGDFAQANYEMTYFGGDENDFHTMLFKYCLDRILATSIYRDGIGGNQADGNWVFPTIGCNSCHFNDDLTPAQKEENYRQWDPGYLNPGAQSVVNRLEPGSRFMLVGDDTTIYTIKRVHIKRLYNHTSWNPSPRIDENGTIIGYNWNNTGPKDSNQGGSVAHYTQAMMDYLTDNNNPYSGSAFQAGVWKDFKDALVRFGKANNRRTTYILQVDKNTTNSLISWDDDDDSDTPNVNNYFPDTADNDTDQVIRFVDNYIEPGANTLPTSPAIFETEADEDVDLNIYYEASDALPIGLDGEKGYLLAPIGTKVTCSVNNCLVDYSSANSLFLVYDFFLKVKSWDGDELELFGPGLLTNPSAQGFATSNDAVGWAGQSGIYGSHYIYFWREDGSYTSAVIDAVTEITDNGFYITKLRIRDNSYQEKVGLSYYNCFSFGNGVESNRVRDDFNESFILNGVKASTVLEEPYEEERRKHGLIYSGIYNSISGVNNLNQFIAAEKITKDLMPSYGSIQKLYARDKDLVTLCEDKIIRVYVDKDILYNADGDTQLLATNRVLGTAEPFRGNYGISKNPESFAAESFRVYFTDKQRGAVLRLSMDGLTPISDAGMHDYFRDNLPINEVLLGSYDAHKGNYNLTMFKNLYRGPFSQGGEKGFRLTPSGCTDPTACNYDPLAEVCDQDPPLWDEPSACCCYPPPGSDDCSGCEGASVSCGGRTEVINSNNQEIVVLKLHENPLESSVWTDYFDTLQGGFGNYTTTVYPFQDYWYMRTYTEHQGDCPEDCGYTCNSSSTNTWECVDGGCVDTGFGNYTEAQCLNQFCGGGGSSTWECVNGTCIDNGVGNQTEQQCLATCVGSASRTYSPPESRGLLSGFGQSKQVKSSKRRQYQDFSEINGSSQVGEIESCCRVPVYLISIKLEVTQVIHANTGMATGSYEWFSWKELMDWVDIQTNTYGVNIGVVEDTVLAYSIYNEEICSCIEIPGCTDPTALNYNPNATIDDGSCTWDDIIGCSDPLASNYNPNATTWCLDCCEYPPYAETVSYHEAAKGWVSFKSFLPELAISSVNQYYTMKQGMLWKHHQETTPETRNTFYNTFEESSVTPVLNTQPDVIKNFNTLNYEGSQTKVDIHLTDNDYYNLYEKKGWYVEDIHTDKQDGTLNEFIEKEGKWFNYIKGKEVVDTAAFNFQGLGVTNLVTGGCQPCAVAAVLGCTDPLATNYDASATVDDGSCILPGCTDPVANNYNASATTDDGSCTYDEEPVEGCTDPLATNYNALATVDDGSCVYTSIPCVTQPVTWTWDGTDLVIHTPGFNPAVLFPNINGWPWHAQTKILRSDGTEVPWMWNNPDPPVSTFSTQPYTSTWSNIGYPYHANTNITPGNYTIVHTVFNGGINDPIPIILSQCIIAITIV